MAMSPSPQPSPIMGSHRHERHHTNSPPPIPSKRDKRRTMIAQNLEEMTRGFTQNKDIHYREQLQAIQIDMNLIMEADAYGKELLQNQPEEIDALVQQNMATVRKSIGLAAPPRAGRIYADFAKEVNDAMEERDAALTVHKRDFDVKMGQLAATHAYRKRLAIIEYTALSSTLRDRLINSVTNKKNRLSRDRETVEIGDSSNALLLHPSQYGLANPASPGGLLGKRATRHRRDADDLAANDSNKRKRKAGDSDESPAPTRQRLDNGHSTPIWFKEKHDLHAQQVESALFSIDKLFTEKELAMTYNASALAAHTYMQRHAPYAETNGASSNGKAESSLDDLAASADAEGTDDGDSPNGADMARQYSHATRSTRAVPNYITGIGIDAISDLNYPGNIQALTKQIPKMPPLLASVMQKGYVKGESANQPAGLSVEDANAEIELMRAARNYNDHHGLGRNLSIENGGRTLLEAVAAPRKYDYWVKSDNVPRGMESNLREEPIQLPLGGETMSRGPSEMGGIAMSRTNTEGGTSSRGRKLKPIPAAG